MIGGLSHFKAALACGACLVALAAGLPANAEGGARLNIPSEPLADSLRAVARQTGSNILFAPEVVAGLRAKPLNGQMTATQAVSALILGLPLEAVSDGAGGLIVRRRPAAPAGPATSSSAPGPGNGSVVDELIVTAEKRAERLQDTPVPVSVTSAAQLVAQNEFRLSDYYSKIPGLGLTQDNRGSAVVSIRGITTSFYTSGSTPTVGITLDDVPFEAAGPSTFSPIPDLDPSELKQVEVLRGPQGVLYGSSSIGGLIKYETVDPSTAGLSGYVKAGLDTISHSHGAGYNLSAGVNAPISDDLAVRISGFHHSEPGFIDNVETGAQHVNAVQGSGGRISALWTPADRLSLKLSALFQESKADGPSQIDVDLPGAGLPPLRGLQQYNLRNTGGYDRTVQAYSAVLNLGLGPATLTSISAYNYSRTKDSFDFTFAFGAATPNQFGVAGTPFVEDNNTRKVSQELRITTPLGARTDWMVGAFYTDERTSTDGGELAEDPSTGAIAGRWVDQTSLETYREGALFTNFTFRLTDRFDVQAGVRQSWERTSNESVLAGPYVTVFLRQPSPDINPRVASTDHALTYLVTPKYQISPDLMIYARIASGFRPGGPNSAINAALKLPTSYGPDTTRNLDLGIKGDAFDNRLNFAVSAYYIDWRNIQLTIYDPATAISYLTNGSRARSQGVEISADARPTGGLTVSGWVDLGDAKITRAFPSAPPSSGLPNAASGDPLPYSSRFSAHLSADQTFPLQDGLTGFVGGDLSYVGDRRGEFTNAPPRQTLPAYAKLDLRAGVERGAWRANVFATNVTNSRGRLQGGIGFFPPYAFAIIQPATVGINLSRQF